MKAGEKLKDLLKQKKITQGGLAQSIGTTQTYISNMITGKVKISAKFAAKIGDALDVPSSYFKDDTGESADLVSEAKTESEKSENLTVSETNTVAPEAMTLTAFEGYEKKETKAKSVSLIRSAYPCEFTYAGVHYYSVVQFVVAQKALMYNDLSCYDLARRSEKEEELQYIAEILNGNDPQLWNRTEKEIYYLANRAKFTESGEMIAELMITGDKDFEAEIRKAAAEPQGIINEVSFLDAALQIKKELMLTAEKKEEPKEEVSTEPERKIQRIKYIVTFPDEFHPKMEEQEVFDIHADGIVEFKKTANRRTLKIETYRDASAEDFKQLVAELEQLRKHVTGVVNYGDSVTAKTIMVLDPYVAESYPRGYSDGKTDMASIMNRFLHDKAHFNWTE